VLDFKPEAERKNENKVASQLFLYASGLSFRTGIPLDRLMCAWFDGSIYYEFNPIEANVRFHREMQWILFPDQVLNLGMILEGSGIAGF